MKKIRADVPAVVLSLPLSLGAFACGSYEAAGNTGGAGPGTGGAGTGGGSNGGAVAFSGRLPCDVLAEAGLPCVAAHSTVRAIVPGYSGPLYQVCKGTATPGPSSCQGEALDIGIGDRKSVV